MTEPEVSPDGGLAAHNATFAELQARSPPDKLLSIATLSPACRLDTTLRATAWGERAGAGLQGETSVGFRAGDANRGIQTTSLGSHAGTSNTGAQTTALGNSAGYENTGERVTAVGYAAGYTNAGEQLTAIGYGAGNLNRGADLTAIGVGAANANAGARVTAVGAFAGARGGGADASDSTMLGANTQVSGPNAIALGAGAIGTAPNQCMIGNAALSEVRSAATFHGAGFVVASDTRAKRDIAPMPDDAAVAFSRAIKFVDFLKTQGARRHAGVVAQQVREVIAATGYGDYLVSAAPDGFLEVDVIGLNAVINHGNQIRLAALEEALRQVGDLVRDASTTRAPPSHRAHSPPA